MFLSAALYPMISVHKISVWVSWKRLKEAQKKKEKT